VTSTNPRDEQNRRLLRWPRRPPPARRRRLRQRSNADDRVRLPECLDEPPAPRRHHPRRPRPSGWRPSRSATDGASRAALVTCRGTPLLPALLTKTRRPDRVPGDRHRRAGYRPHRTRPARRRPAKRSSRASGATSTSKRRDLYLQALGYRYHENAKATGSTYTAVNRRLAEGRTQLRRLDRTRARAGDDRAAARQERRRGRS
jgi:hypothetical protein